MTDLGLSKVDKNRFCSIFCTALVPLTPTTAIIIVAEVSEIVEEFHDGARWCTMVHDGSR